ncbi:hypothetical protein [Amycolatopsis sp. NPDC051128]|uniref:hypothetical protein n=1 Tax=Amycolatopsis sp. NPDC051128 TaxID=3155412 RepID=UPI003415B594
MTMPIPVQESVEARVARRSGALRTRTANPSLTRVFVVGRRRFGSDHAAGAAATTKATATTSPAGPPSSPASPGPASAAAVNVSASSRLARCSAGPVVVSGLARRRGPATAGS